MMVTETSREHTEERYRCQMGRHYGSWCWREATERLSLEWPEPEVCAEHLEHMRLGRRATQRLDTLRTIGEWRLGSPECQEDTLLEAHTSEIFARAASDYWSAAVKAFAADLVAVQGPDREPLSLEDAERLAEPWLLSDALLDAHVTLEDLQGVPAEAFGTRDAGRWSPLSPWRPIKPAMSTSALARS